MLGKYVFWLIKKWHFYYKKSMMYIGLKDDDSRPVSVFASLSNKYFAVADSFKECIITYYIQPIILKQTFTRIYFISCLHKTNIGLANNELDRKISMNAHENKRTLRKV